MPFFHKFKTISSKQFFLEKKCCSLLQAPKCLLTCVNCVTNCAMPKIGWQSDLHGKMNLNILIYYIYIVAPPSLSVASYSSQMRYILVNMRDLFLVKQKAEKYIPSIVLENKALRCRNKDCKYVPYNYNYNY